MTFRDDLRAICHEVRAIPADLGVRPYTVAIVTRAWSGDEPGQGTLTTTTTAITEANGAPPKVRSVSGEELLLGTTHDTGTVEVGPITPDFPGGGTLIAALAPVVGNGQTQFHFVLTGPDYPNGANFACREYSTDHGYHYKLTLERVADT